MKRRKISEKRAKYYLRKTKLGVVTVASTVLLTFGISSKVVLAEESNSSETLENSTTTNETAATPTENSTINSPQNSATTETSATPETTAPETTVAPTAPAVTETAQPAANVEAVNYQATILLIGQWTNESSKKVDTTRQYQSADDKLGAPESNPGSLRGLAKTFLGWSDKAPVGNGKLAEGARLFSPEDKISLVFPNGITNDTKLYAVYFSLNDPNTPWPSDSFSMGFAFLSSVEAYRKAFDNNKVTINSSVTPEATLPNTTLKQATDNSVENKTTIIDKYDEKIDDVNTVNEVVLKAEFEMDKSVSMAVHKNPLGQHYARPILSRDYNTRYATGEFNTQDGRNAGYTYVDLKVSLHNDITVPNKLYLNFKGYSWRPLYVLDSNKNILNIFDPKTGAALGNDKNSFSSLISNTSPNVTFGVETNGAKYIVVRTVLREGDTERISDANVVPSQPSLSIAEEITSNMILRTLSSSEIKALDPSLSTQEVNERVVRISNARAKASADANTLTNITDTLDVSGTVDGHIFVNAGTVSVPFLGAMTLGGDAKLSTVASNVVALGYVQDYKVTHEFKSGTQGKDLPQAIMNRLPKDVLGVNNGEVVRPGQTDTSEYEDTNLNGKWVFTGWDKESETINGANGHFIGIWEFVENVTPQPDPNPTPDPQPQPDPNPTPDPQPQPNPMPDSKPEQPKQPQKPKEPNKQVDKPKVAPKKESKKVLPKTGSSNQTWVFGTASALLLTSLGLAIRSKKED